MASRGRSRRRDGRPRAEAYGRSVQPELLTDLDQVWVAAWDAIAVELPEPRNLGGDVGGGRVISEETLGNGPERLAGADDVDAAGWLGDARRHGTIASASRPGRAEGLIDPVDRGFTASRPLSEGTPDATTVQLSVRALGREPRSAPSCWTCVAESGGDVGVLAGGSIGRPGCALPGGDPSVGPVRPCSGPLGAGICGSANGAARPSGSSTGSLSSGAASGEPSGAPGPVSYGRSVSPPGSNVGLSVVGSTTCPGASPPSCEVSGSAAMLPAGVMAATPTNALVSAERAHLTGCSSLLGTVRVSVRLPS